jgi:hypothetical protein
LQRVEEPLAGAARRASAVSLGPALGNQFAQRHGQIQAPIADDPRGPEEQSLRFRELWLSPIETPEGGVRVLDEVGRDDGLRPSVEPEPIY